MGCMTKGAFAVLLLGILLSYAPVIEFLVELEQYSEEDAVWKEWTSPKGDFIGLSKGNVHYILEGKPDAPLV